MAAPEQQETLGLSILLIGLAGWVDAVGFVAAHGIFPSFMSGNSTTLGVELAHRHWGEAGRVAVLVAVFVVGATVGEALALAFVRLGRWLVFVLEACLLWAAAWVTGAGLPEFFVLLPLSFAMGVQNAAVHRAGGIAVTLTYVTGTLVHLGQACARVVLGRDTLASPLPWAGMWGGLMVGAVAGGWMAVTQGRLVALVVPAALATALAARGAWVRP